MKFGLLILFDHYAEDCSEEQYYKNFLDEVVYDEELGFDSIWIGEHHFCRYICPAPFSRLSDHDRRDRPR